VDGAAAEGTLYAGDVGFFGWLNCFPNDSAKAERLGFTLIKEG
jgi:hypothetical protein